MSFYKSEVLGTLRGKSSSKQTFSEMQLPEKIWKKFKHINGKFNRVYIVSECKIADTLSS